MLMHWCKAHKKIHGKYSKKRKNASLVFFYIHMKFYHYLYCIRVVFPEQAAAERTVVSIFITPRPPPSPLFPSTPTLPHPKADIS